MSENVMTSLTNVGRARSSVVVMMIRKGPFCDLRLPVRGCSYADKAFDEC